MALRISRTQRTQLLDWAKAARPRECCGLLLGRGEVISEVRLARNVAGDAENHFEIDPADLIAAHKGVRNGEPMLLGHFHSHPNGLARPSATDLAMATDDGGYWLIIAEDSLTAWQPVAVRAKVVRFEKVSLIVEG